MPRTVPNTFASLTGHHMIVFDDATTARQIVCRIDWVVSYVEVDNGGSPACQVTVASPGGPVILHAFVDSSAAEIQTAIEAPAS